MIQNMMVIKEDWLECFTSFLIKKSTSLNKSSRSGVADEPNYHLTNELHKPIIRKCKKRKVYSSFRTMFGVLILLICNH